MYAPESREGVLRLKIIGEFIPDIFSLTKRQVGYDDD